MGGGGKQASRRRWAGLAYSIAGTWALQPWVRRVQVVLLALSTNPALQAKHCLPALPAMHLRWEVERSCERAACARHPACLPQLLQQTASKPPSSMPLLLCLPSPSPAPHLAQLGTKQRGTHWLRLVGDRNW